MYLLDTCALLWWTLDPSGLSQKALKACKKIDTDGGFISSISIWEIGIKMKKGSLEIGISLGEYVERLKRTEGVEIIPVDETIWVENLLLNWKHNDPADRTIVATALMKKLPIVTKDKLIIEYYKNSIW